MENAFVTKDMTIGDVVSRFPEAAMLLSQRGLHCIGCHVNPYETIEQGSLGHGMSDEEIDEMVGEVNEYISRNIGKEPARKEEQYGGEPVFLTDAAVSKLKELMDKQGLAERGLRVSVMPGGCAGFTYGLDFDSEREGDHVTEQAGVKVLVDKQSIAHLKGINIDYVDGLHGSGFKIENPHATSSCGCGKSFS